MFPSKLVKKYINYEGFEEFQKDISYLLGISKNPQNLKLLQDTILKNIEEVISQQYYYDYGSFTKYDEFQLSSEQLSKLLNYLSDNFSIEINTEIILIINKHFKSYQKDLDNAHQNIYDDEDIILIQLDKILEKDIVTAKKLIKTILDYYVHNYKCYLNKVVSGKFNTNSYLEDTKYNHGTNLINEIYKYNSNLNFKDCLEEHEKAIQKIIISPEYISVIKKGKLSDEEEANRKVKENSGCFIATATMGSYDHPVVIDLRIFRDNWLLKRKWGVNFTKWYYIYGAKAAKCIEGSFLLKKLAYLFIVKPLHFFTKKIK